MPPPPVNVNDGTNGEEERALLDSAPATAGPGTRRHNLYSKSAGSRDVTAQNLLRQHERLDAG